jgi:hypothetical protein
MQFISGWRRWALVFGFVGAAASVSGTHAQAESGWTRAPQGPFKAPAGVLCPFAIGGESLKDDVVLKTVATFPDGSPSEQFFKGALIVRFTDLDTGAYVDRSLSGVSHVFYGADGSQTVDGDGPAAYAFFPADNIPRGIYVLKGSYEVYYAPDFSFRRLTPVDGPKEDLCDTLQ